MSDAPAASTDNAATTTPERPTQPPADEETALVAADGEATSPSNDGQVQPAFLSHIERVYKSSETRTPLIANLRDGDPYNTVVTLAKRSGCTVWTISMESEKNEQNALDYVEVGTQNGDWVYLTNVEQASAEVLRQLAMTLYTLKPEPKRFPRRSLFRMWLVTQRPFDVNDRIKPVFPQSLLSNALVARARVPPGLTEAPPSPEKFQRRIPADAALLENELAKHEKRREVGRDSDSESDQEEPEKKATGMWFHRAVDFYAVDGGTTLARVNEVIFEAIEKEDVATIKELCNSGRLNIDGVKHEGMNPIMYAVSRERVESAKALLECGADATVRRPSDNSPLLFMCIESEELLTALIEAGANIDERYEGYRLEDHPTTQPHIAAIVRDLKGAPAK